MQRNESEKKLLHSTVTANSILPGVSVPNRNLSRRRKRELEAEESHSLDDAGDLGIYQRWNSRHRRHRQVTDFNGSKWDVANAA